MSNDFNLCFEMFIDFQRFYRISIDFKDFNLFLMIFIDFGVEVGATVGRPGAAWGDGGATLSRHY